MSNNPTAILVRPVGLEFCLARRPKSDEDLTCTRLNNHRGHCCDEVVGVAWDARGLVVVCPAGHNHSKEKGLVEV